MLPERTSEANRSLGVIPPIVVGHPDDIKSAKITGRWTLHVVFYDGTKGEVNMEKLANSSRAGVFEALRDPDFFSQAFLQWGFLTWPGELDLSTDSMYEAIKETGYYSPS